MSTANGSPSGGGRSIGQVFASITEDIASLVRDEIALAKAEVRQSLVRAGRGALLIAGAIALVNTAFIFLLITIGYALVAAGLPVWGAFLIVTLVLIAGAAVMVLVDRSVCTSMDCRYELQVVVGVGITGVVKLRLCTYAGLKAEALADVKVGNVVVNLLPPTAPV